MQFAYGLQMCSALQTHYGEVAHKSTRKIGEQSRRQGLNKLVA